MNELKLGLFGGFRLESAGGQPVPVPTKKAKALLAYLALHGGQPQPRAKLASLLWEDSDQVQARESLRQALKLLRQALSPTHTGSLIAQDDAVMFQPGALSIDIIDFQRLLAGCGPEELKSAAELYRGVLLEGFDLDAPEFESWLAAQRQRLNEKALAGLEKLLSHHLANNAVESAITVATRLLALDPLRESAHRGLMQLYCKQGRHATALRQFRICAETLKKELGVEPDAATIALYREIRQERNRPQNGVSLPEPTALDPVVEPTHPTGTTASAWPALQLPDKPSIAVLPFRNMSGDPEQDYFADGIVEEIITALSQFRQLFVIACNSSFTYKGRSVDVRQVGRELGVRYVLEGSVRKAPDRLRITGQLIDASTGEHLWADRFEGGLEDIFDLQDQMTARVVGAITEKVDQAEIERIKRKPTESLAAYDCYLRGKIMIRQRTMDANEQVRTLLQKAIQLDPDFAAAYAMAGNYYQVRKSNGWMVDRVQETAEAERLARRAVALGGDDAYALALAGHILAYVVGELDDGTALIDRALALNPNLYIAWHWSGWSRTWLGEPELAIEHQLRAIRLNPLSPLIGWMQAAVASAHFIAGRYDEASSWADKAMRGRPEVIPAVRIDAASKALAGRTEEAKQVCARLRQLDPALRISNLKERTGRYRRPEDLARYEEGLRKAGLPE